MNKVIRFLLLSDVFIITGFGLIAPILAIYINENLIGGTMLRAGIASAIFLITKSIIQIPFSKFVDKKDEYFDLMWLLLGALLVCIVPFIYIFSDTIWGIFFAQFLYGIGSAFSYPTWLKIWNSHLDSHHETFEWSVYSSAIALSSAFASVFGAWISEIFGFITTFAFVGIISFVGFVMLGYLRKYINHEKNHVHGILLEFPELRQMFNYDCGASVTQNVLVYYGKEIREDILIHEEKTNSKVGTPLHNIVKEFRHFGLKTIQREMTLEDVKKFLRGSIPVILLLQAWTEKEKIDWINDWDDGHYVVAIGYDHEKIYFEDPSSFERTYLTFEELRKRWHDIDVAGQKYYNYGIAVYGRKPKFSNHKIIHMD